MAEPLDSLVKDHKKIAQKLIDANVGNVGIFVVRRLAKTGLLRT